MHIFLPWWLAAILPLVVGTGFGMSLRWKQWDIITPMIALGSIAVGLGMTAGIFIGHFV